MRRNRESRQFRLFDAVEQTIERVVEGSVGRLLPSRLQPAEIARRLEREMTVQQVVSIDGPIAPNAFRVLVSPSDAEQLAGYSNRLTDDLQTWLESIAIERNLRLVGPIAVEIDADERVTVRTMRITAAMIEAPAVEPAEETENEPAVSYSLEIMGGRGLERAARLREGFTIIGRAPASDLVIDDPSVSRFHARVEVSGRRIDVRDLDSTNGTRVNGRQVNSAPLEVGDLVAFGSIEARVSLSHGRNWS